MLAVANALAGLIALALAGRVPQTRCALRRVHSGAVQRRQLEEWLKEDCREALQGVDAVTVLDLLQMHTYGERLCGLDRALAPLRGLPLLLVVAWMDCDQSLQW